MPWEGTEGLLEKQSTKTHLSKKGYLFVSRSPLKYYRQGSARDRDRVPENFQFPEPSPGIPHPTNLGPGPSPGSRMLELRYRSLSQTSGTGTAGSRGHSPGGRPLIIAHHSYIISLSLSALTPSS